MRALALLTLALFAAACGTEGLDAGSALDEAGLRLADEEVRPPWGDDEEAEVVELEEQGFACGGMSIRPQAPVEHWGDFQAVPGTGVMPQVVLSFACPVRTVTATIWDPDFAGNEMIAYDDEGEVARASFTGDGAPGVLTTDTVSVSAARITSVVLAVAPGEYVTYSDVRYAY